MKETLLCLMVPVSKCLLFHFFRTKMPRPIFEENESSGFSEHEITLPIKSCA